MVTTIYIVKANGNAKLGIMPHPRGGDWLADDLASIAQQGFDVVVSLLEKNEQADMELADELEACSKLKIQFVNIPVPDRGTPPSEGRFVDVISSLSDLWASGKSVAIHCRMAYGRAPMLAACILISRGESARDAIAAASAARGVPVPETPEQLAWIYNYERIARSH